MKWVLVVPRMVIGSDGCRAFPFTLAALSEALRGLGENVRDLDLHRIPGPGGAALTAELAGDEDVAVVCVDRPTTEASTARVFEIAKAGGARTVAVRDTAQGGSSANADLTLPATDALSLGRLTAGVRGISGRGGEAPSSGAGRPSPRFMGLTASETFAPGQGAAILPLALLDESADLLMGFADSRALNTYARETAGDPGLENFLAALGLELDGLWAAAARSVQLGLPSPTGQRRMSVIKEEGMLPEGVLALRLHPAGSRSTGRKAPAATILRDLAASTLKHPPVRYGIALAAARWLIDNGDRAAAKKLANAVLGTLGERPDRTVHKIVEAFRQIAAQGSGKGADSGAEAVSSTLRGRFCPRPFAALAIDSEGRKSIGCEEHLTLPLGAADHNSGLAFLNNPDLRRLRESILLGSFDFCRHDSCPLIVADQLPNRDEGRNVHIGRHVREHPRQVGRMSDATLRRSIVAYESVITSDLALRVDLPDTPSVTSSAFTSALDLVPCARSVVLRRTGGVLNGEDGRALMDEIAEHSVPAVTIESDGRDLTSELLGGYLERGLDLRIVIIAGAGAADIRFADRHGEDYDLLSANFEYLSRERHWERVKHLSVRFDYDADTFADMPAVAGLIDVFGWDGVVFRAAPSAMAEGKAVHRSAHPQHQAFVEICRDDAMDDQRIDDDFAFAQMQEFQTSR